MSDKPIAEYNLPNQFGVDLLRSMGINAEQIEEATITITPEGAQVELVWIPAPDDGSRISGRYEITPVDDDE